MAICTQKLELVEKGWTLHNTRENKTQISGQELVKQTRRNELSTSKPEKKTGLNASKQTGDRVNGIKLSDILDGILWNTQQGLLQISQIC